MSDQLPQPAIDGVRLYPLRVIEDARGAVLHMMRTDWPVFEGFGEVYFSEIRPGVLKAWKRHRRTTQHLVVPVGRVEFALHDDRRESPSRGRTERHQLGRPDAYHLFVIPPLVWYAWRCLSDHPALVANCIAEPHDPSAAEQSDHPAGLHGFVW